jgi:gas vesicle protein
MTNKKNCTTDLMLGAIAGGIAGALTVLLLAPKFVPKSANTTNEMIQSLSNHYDGIRTKASSLIENITQKSQEIAQGVSSYTEEWAEKTLTISNTVIDELSRWESAIKEAIITTTVQAEQMTESEGHDKLIDTLEWARKALNVAENAIKEINSWAEVIRDTAEGATPQSKAFKSDAHRSRTNSYKNEEPTSHIAKEVLEWATLGLNLWQSVKKQR